MSPGPAAAEWSGDPLDNVSVCTAPNDQSDPTLVADGVGGVIVAWFDNRGGVHYHIYAQHLQAGGTLDASWPAGDLAVSTATNDQSMPVIASDGSGGALIAWSAVPDGAPSGHDVYAQHVLANGVADPTWPAIGCVVCSAGGNQDGPRIVSDGAGGAVVTWIDYRNPSGYTEIYAQHVLATGAIDTTWPTDGRALATGAIDRYGLVTIADDAGGAIATWYELHFGTNYDIVAQRVLADGTLNPAWPVNGLPVCAAAEPQVNPKLVADGTGGAIIVWADERGGIGANDIYAQHVLAGGAVDVAWPADGLALCTAENGQSKVVLVTDGAGGALVAWEDMRSGVPNIYAQHTLAVGAVDASWPADGAALCGAAGNQTDPAIVADGTGGATVAWIDGRGNCIPDLYAQHVRSDGTLEPAWPADGLPVSTAPMSKYQPTIVDDGARGAIIVWDGRRGNSSYDVFAQVVRANGWLGDSAPPVQHDDAAVCTAAEYQLTPSIVTDGAGGGIITWQDGRNAIDYDIYAQRVLANGEVDPTWPADGRALCVAADVQLTPVIATDGAGGAIVAWADHRGGVDYDVYVQHVLANGATDPTWPTDGRALCASSGDQMECAIVSDGAGGAIVTWQDFRNGIDQDIYAQHIGADGNVDPNWPVDGRALCTAAENQYAPKICADGGSVIVSWFDYRGGPSDIYAQRVLSNGTVDPAWPADGRALCTAANYQVYPAIIADGAGGAFVTWNDGRITTNSYNDVYAQHVLSSGAVDPAWPVDGRALCTAGTKQGFPPPVIVADGVGGAFVAWADSRHGPSSYADIYAQHVGADGALDAAWPANGRGVCTEGSEQNTPAIVSDDAGGAIVTWVDQRAGCSTDVYAQHVLAGNAQDPAWPGDGRAVTRAAGYQYSPVATADGAGGVIVAWEDYRGGVAYDIYSQHLMGDGVTAALISLVSVEADVKHVLVTWFAPQNGTVRVYRHEEQTGWLAVGSAHPDGSGLISHLDRAVEAGKRYGYRVGLSSPTGEQYLGETWVMVTASSPFDFEDLRPNPADQNVEMSFSLSGDVPATVELIDLAGRVVATHRLAVLQGRQMINLREGSVLPAGIYLVRLRQGERSAIRKLCLVH